MHHDNEVGAGESDPAARLGPAEREHLRERMESERTRIEHRLRREDVDLTTHRRQVSERAPCAILGRAAALEDARQEIRSDQARETSRQLQEVEQGLRRLREEPDRFGLCVRCEQAVSAARLEVLPFTTLCARCAVGNQ